MLSRIWRRQPGKFFCISTKSGSGAWNDKFFERSEFDLADRYPRLHRDKDVYSCYHGFSKPQRIKRYAVMPKLLWADLDNIDPRDIAIEPTVAIESSPGRYVALWETDQTIEESINRRLTYWLGADHGGWDLTQVLRVPNTTNYKYDNLPKVRLLWDDGPIWKLSDIVRQLPKEDTDTKNEEAASEIFNKYEKDIPGEIRATFRQAPRPDDDRSKVIWKLNHEFLNSGMSKEEAFIVLKASAWNKFRGRRDEDQQLRRELEKADRSRFKATKDDTLNGYKFGSKPVAEVPKEDGEWLWYPFIPLDEVTIIEGDPGVGKSYLVQMIMKSVCDGTRLPTMMRIGKIFEHYRAGGNVLYFDTENKVSTVTRNRLDWNGIKHPERYFQEDKPFMLAGNQDAIKKVCEAIERIKPIAVVFDPISLYIGRADLGKTNETTQALQIFAEIARRYHCAVILVRHLTKDKEGKTSALYRGQGSISFAGVARSVITVGRDPEDRSLRVMAVTKFNNDDDSAKSLTYEITKAATLKEPLKSQFEWGDWVDLRSDQILGASKTKHTGVEQCVEWLKTVFDETDKIEAKRVMTMGEKRGFDERMIHRAADRLNIKKSQEGARETRISFWHLP